jgi:hypothetical protein
MLGGSSFGALTAAWASVDHEDLAERLFLLAPAFGFVERHAGALSEEDRERWASGEPLTVEKEWFTVDLHPAILHETSRRKVSDLARRLALPSLIIHGRRDESVQLDDVFAFVRTCAAPGLELLVLGDGDHRLTGHKERLGEELLRFAGLD